MEVSSTSTGLKTIHPSIAKLVTLLDNPDASTQVKALKSIFSLGRNARNRKHLMEAEAHKLILSKCASPSEEVKENIGKALFSLAEEEPFADQIGRVGIVDLLNLLSSSNPDTIINTSKALLQLGRTAQNRNLLLQYNGLTKLVSLLGHENEWVKLQATKTLMTVFSDGPELGNELDAQTLGHIYVHFEKHILEQSINPRI